MVAFRSAVEDWAVDMLETDARLTADGRVVLIHDEAVDRTTDGVGAVRSFTFEQLTELDAGFRFLDLDGSASFAGKGVRVPLLEEVIEAFPDVWINVEAKCAEVAGPLVEVIRRAGAQDRVLVAAEFESRRRDAVGYSGPWGASVEQVLVGWVLQKTGFGGRHRPAYDILQIPERRYGLKIVTRGLVEVAHGWNVPVHVWVVDGESDMRRLLEMGVDGIQTDRLDTATRVFSDLVGRPLPPAAQSSGDPY